MVDEWVVCLAASKVEMLAVLSAVLSVVYLADWLVAELVVLLAG